MELKPGYKQTEAGVIPGDWDVQPLKNLSSKIMVGIASAATHAYRSSGVPMIRNQNIKEGWLDDSDLRFLDPGFDEVFQGKRLCGGDLLTARTGYPGTTAVVPPEYTGAQSFTSLITRPDVSRIDSGYLCLYINSPAGKAFFEQSQIGGAQKNVNVKSLKRMPVAFPKAKEEQESIANAVAEVDALISSLESLISKKLAIKQAAMQELLTGKRRLQGFEGEWVLKRLGDIAEIRSGGTPSTTQPDFWDGDVPWCTPSDITALSGSKYLHQASRTISRAGLQASSAELIPPHSVIMTSRATIGECAINPHPIATNQGFKNLVPAEDVDVEFLYYLMCTQKAGLTALCGGSTFLEIGKKQVSNYQVFIPIGRDEQAAIAAILSDIDAELAALEARRDKTRELKQGMMQELLTGRIRLQ